MPLDDSNRASKSQTSSAKSSKKPLRGKAARTARSAGARTASKAAPSSSNRQWIYLAAAGIAIAIIGFWVVYSSTQAGTSGAGSTTTSASSTTGAAAGASSTPQGETLYTPKYKLNGAETATIVTSKGTIKVKFFEKDAPITVASFIELAEKGYYTGIKFHRYVKNVVIQGGDPNTKSATAEQVAAADAGQTGQFGSGGPGYTIADEFANNPNLHVDGTLAMARTQSPNSGGSQFYFALTALPSLDHNYTVFGQVTSGLDVVHQLRAGDEIKSITVENASK